MLRRILAAVLAMCLAAPAVFAQLPSNSRFGPTASFRVSATSIGAGQAITVDASQSRDARGQSAGLSFRWDFESNFEWTDWNTNAVGNYTYLTSGVRSIRLQVRDSAGLIDETKLTVTVSESKKSGPRAKFSVSPESGTTDTQFVFTAEAQSLSVASSYFTAGLEYRWDFDGDGSWDTDFVRDATAYHVFGSAGYKEVWLQVRDENGLTTIERGYYVTGKEDDSNRNKQVGRIRVESGQKIRAAFTVQPASPEVVTTVVFDARDSQFAAEYRWDFDGDGSWDAAWSSNPVANFKFVSPGSYRARLQVRNSTGGTDEFMQQLDVRSATPAAIQATLTVSNASQAGLGEGFGVIGDEFLFSAAAVWINSVSYTNLTARFDFEGDGVWDTTFGSLQANHRYSNAGTFPARVEIRTDRGATATATNTIRIGNNTLPEAKLIASPARATRTTQILLDATGSRDRQSSSGLTARFDFEGDGVWDTDFSTNLAAQYRYPRVGTFSPRVELADHSGGRSRASTTVEILAEPAARAGFTASPSIGTFGTTFTFDATQAVPESGRLQFRWNFDSIGRDDTRFNTYWSENPVATFRFTSVGTKKIHLLARNAEGQLSDYFQEIQVHPASPAIADLARRGIATDDGDPDRLVTAAELARIVVTASRVPASYSQQYFVDVPMGTWFADSATIASQRGWIPRRVEFRGDEVMTRADAARAAVAALSTRVVPANQTSSASDIPANLASKRFAHFVVAEKLLANKTGSQFRPNDPITRAELAQLVSGLLAQREAEMRQPYWLFGFVSSPAHFLADALKSLR